jgi:phenylacetate-CoA ligase
LIGYASIMVRLANEQLHHRLHITPERVTTNSEPLDSEGRATILSAWGVKTNNTWGSVEMGIAGIENDRHEGLILSEDMIIFDPVDEQLNPINHPQDAKKLIITNLFNKTLPLIRYVVDDVLEIVPKSFTNYHVTPNIAGRTDDWFNYPGDLAIHPMVFWHVLGQEPDVSEYQVEQTLEGAIVRVIAYPGLNQAALTQRLEQALEKSGLKHPNIRLDKVTQIKRHQETGKLRRFMPLG